MAVVLQGRRSVLLLLLVLAEGSLAYRIPLRCATATGRRGSVVSMNFLKKLLEEV